MGFVPVKRVRARLRAIWGGGAIASVEKICKRREKMEDNLSSHVMVSTVTRFCGTGD